MTGKLALVATALVSLCGCAAIPEIAHQPRFHNPFPQLHRVAVLPFFNLSADPSVDSSRFALAYFNALQEVPGFEVMPVGVVVARLQQDGIVLDPSTDFQALARHLGVDALLVGAVTDYDPYYPPRLGLSVNWYAANPGFHPIPAGYGLPWGTAEEEYIPDSLVQEAEFALAREQLKTQTPEFAPPDATGLDATDRTDARPDGNDDVTPAAHTEPADASDPRIEYDESFGMEGAMSEDLPPGMSTDLPPDWPDPSGFIPAPPSPVRPELVAHEGPIIEHTRIYNGHDSEFTEALANYYYFRDEARFGGWHGYLQRSEDFIRFCCYLHLTETLAARGGAGKTRVVWRWPIGR